MEVNVHGVHVLALIQCRCGEFVSLSHESSETCPKCLRRYKIEVSITEAENIPAINGSVKTYAELISAT